jgi:hypothetical protein
MNVRFDSLRYAPLVRMITSEFRFLILIAGLCMLANNVNNNLVAVVTRAHGKDQ